MKNNIMYNQIFNDVDKIRKGEDTELLNKFNGKTLDNMAYFVKNELVEKGILCINDYIYDWYEYTDVCIAKTVGYVVKLYADYFILIHIRQNCEGIYTQYKYYNYNFIQLKKSELFNTREYKLATQFKGKYNTRYNLDRLIYLFSLFGTKNSKKAKMRLRLSIMSNISNK